MFCLKQLRNGTLTRMKAMSQKDLSSDNDSSFAMGRHVYTRTLGTYTTLVNNNAHDTITKNVQKGGMVIHL